MKIPEIFEKLLAIARKRHIHEDCKEYELTDNELLSLYDFIENRIKNPTIEETVELDLDIEGELEYYNDIEENFDDTDEELFHSLQNSSQDRQSHTIDRNIFTYNQIKKIIEFYDNCKVNKFKQTQRRYPRITDPSYISRFRRYLEQNGTEVEKFSKIEEYTFQKFLNARNVFVNVHDIDLRRWAIDRASQLGCRFQASESWILSFKRRNRIVSRKVTKYIVPTEKIEDLQLDMQKFLNEFKEKADGIPPFRIYNFDQSGFTYEYTSRRTLSTKGEKEIKSMIMSHHAIRHSLSIMPIISMNGKLVGKMLICLQERGGKFGPRVNETMLSPPNIDIVCSNSGKLEKDIMKIWFRKNLAITESEPFILILGTVKLMKTYMSV
jgi:hypothetical protein